MRPRGTKRRDASGPGGPFGVSPEGPFGSAEFPSRAGGERRRPARRIGPNANARGLVRRLAGVTHLQNAERSLSIGSQSRYRGCYVEIENIERVLVFRETDHVWTQQELEAKFHLVPNGSLNYFGVVKQNVDNLLATGRAMNPDLLSFMNDVVTSLRNSNEAEKTVVLGVEPSEPGDPFEYVRQHLDLISHLAEDAQDYQLQALRAGKRLNIVMRYASEMNAGEAIYAGDEVGFKRSFAEVRDTVRTIAPDVLFSFSPALRSDIDEAAITRYWPGDEHVDVVGATWYDHGDDATRRKAVDCMKAYFLHRIGTGKPFGLDEFGGALGSGAVYRDNDDVLQEMLHVIAGLQFQNVSFKYGVIFVDGNKWGVDATLDFLRNGSPVPA